MTTAEIPVWVNSRQRWVTGVNRKTTCDDVIAVLLKSEGARGSGGGGSGDGGDGAGCVSGGGGAGASTVVGDGHGYAIMERWRRVERPLDGRARILKVWHAWGDAQGEVRLTLRRVDHSEADSGRGSPSRDPPAAGSGPAPAAAGPPPPAHQRRRRHHHRSQHHHHHHRHRERDRGDAKPPWPAAHETVHPRRLAQLQGAGGGSSKLPETIERLMKLILQQGETIQSQLRKLQEREHQIEHLEDETHRARVEALGSNYLLETYLGSQLDAEEDEEEKGNDSGVVTEGGSEQASGSSPSSGHDDEAPRCLGARPRVDDDEANFADESDDGTKERSAAEDGALLDLKTQVDLWEKLVKVNKRLEREEETLVRLHIKFRRLQSERPAEGAEGEGEDGGGGAATALRVLPEEELDAEECQARDALLGELERVRAQLEHGSREMEQTAHALAEAEALLDARRRYLRRLQAELDASDRETDRLQRQIAAAVAAAANAPAPVAPPPPPPPAHPVAHPPAAIAKAKTDAPISSANMNDTDSNSDTGLSSLHSGSEEGVYILDTLV